MRVTSDPHHAQIVVRIVGLVPVHVGTLGISITEISEVAVRGTVLIIALSRLVNAAASCKCR